MPKLTEREFYCVKCRKIILCDANNIKAITYHTKRGVRHALKCKCKKCNTNLTKFVPTQEFPALARLYGVSKKK